MCGSMEQSNKPNNKPNNKPTDKSGIYWIQQDNQITPFITDFLELLQHRVNSFTKINFLIPSHNSDTLKAAKKLNPIPFKMSSKIKPNSLGGFKLKKSLIGDHEFSDGLSFWRTLLLDDLGSGNLFRAQIHHEIESDTQAIILQIPTPLGSSASEERVFYAWVYLAKQAGIPVLGYELLPLDTRWTLAPSLLDGVITTSYDSYRHLTENKTDMKKKIWLAPRYEGRFFLPGMPSILEKRVGSSISISKRVKD